MIKSWLFEFLPEMGGPSTEPDPRDVAIHFLRYLDLWVRDEALGFVEYFSMSTIWAGPSPIC